MSLRDPVRRWTGLRICSVATAQASKVVPFTVSGRPHILLSDGSDFFACERFCPHEFADLAKGHCKDGRLLCPRHRAFFDLRTGDVSAGWSIPRLRTLPVHVAGGHVYVDADEAADASA